MNNFDLAPPPMTGDGLLAVPMDIGTLIGNLVFDGSAETAVADISINFTMGPDAGNPIFDLRQTIPTRINAS